jgi:Glycine/serine hydroxymethyltransferase
MNKVISVCQYFEKYTVGIRKGLVVKSVIFELIAEELRRQEGVINLIASENYANKEVLAALGSVLTNKYAEGYPGRRYYGGCEVVDKVEQRAIDMGKKLFEAEHVNVQAHSGSSANMAVYFSQLVPGDTVLGMGFQAGGHLTHGYKVNFSGKLFNFIQYGVSPEDELLDYDEIEILAEQHRPKMIVAGASAYSRIIDYRRLYDIAERNRAILFVDMAHVAGLIAAKVHPSPMPFAHMVSSTTHKTLRGPRGGFICCKGDFAQSIDRSILPGTQGGPLLNVIAAKAIAFEDALLPSFRVYQEQVVKNAQVMATTLQELGYRIVSGGTDTHLFLVDVAGCTGVVAEQALGKCNIVVNRNAIPFDKESVMVTSGIRIGTPAMTTRGFTEVQVKQVAHWIDEAIKRRDDEARLKGIREKVSVLCQQFPIY